MSPLEMLDLIRRTHPSNYWRSRIYAYLAAQKFPMQNTPSFDWHNVPIEEK
jgi:hypothetical protein